MVRLCTKLASTWVIQMPVTAAGSILIVFAILVTGRALSIAATLKIKGGTSFSKLWETSQVYHFMRFLEVINKLIQTFLGQHNS